MRLTRQPKGACCVILTDELINIQFSLLFVLNYVNLLLTTNTLNFRIKFSLESHKW